jgi:hypothetical protein
VGDIWETVCPSQKWDIQFTFFVEFVHGLVRYEMDRVLFPSTVFVLPEAGGYTIQKTGAVWVSLLFQAGPTV